jgi:hypothetical protein
MKLFLLAGWLALATFSFAAESSYAWQDTTQYRPPNFEGTFATDNEASQRLERALPNLERSRSAAEDSFELLRVGLRNLRVDRQMPALRWFGNAFIWNKSPQDARAIDLMYHAAGSTNSNISYNAIYFGLSTVRPLSDNIRRALIEAAMRSEDPNLLSRVAWAAASEKSEFLKHLQPFLNSPDRATHEHAESLRAILAGEIKAFAWAANRARESAQQKFAPRLEEIRNALSTGDSAKRRETLDLIQKERIDLILDDSFIAAFAKAAEDTDAKNRNAIATIAGSRWIWNSTNQPAAAIDLMLRLSHDDDRRVRYNANYYGLSPIRNRSEQVIERMLEMLTEDGLDNRDFRQRVFWGLKSDLPKTTEVLDKTMRGADPIKALFAYGIYLDLTGQQPAALAALDKLLQQNEPIANLLAIGPTAGWKPASENEFWTNLRKDLPAEHSKNLIWPDRDGPPFLFATNEQTDSLKKSLVQNPRFKIVHQKPLTAQALVAIGKEGGLKNIK